jgi:hypothetical protein
VKKDPQSKWTANAVEVAMLISHNDFKLKLIRRDKEGHITSIKRTINQEYIAIVTHAPNVSALTSLNKHYRSRTQKHR